MKQVTKEINSSKQKPEAKTETDFSSLKENIPCGQLSDNQPERQNNSQTVKTETRQEPFCLRATKKLQLFEILKESQRNTLDKIRIMQEKPPKLYFDSFSLLEQVAMCSSSGKIQDKFIVGDFIN